MAAVWERSKHQGGALLVLLGIADHANDQGVAYPSIERLARKIRDVSVDAQMLIVTHNKKTMELAQRLYGVTMQEPGVSSIISTTLDDAPVAAPPVEPQREPAAV